MCLYTQETKEVGIAPVVNLDLNSDPRSLNLAPATFICVTSGQLVNSDASASYLLNKGGNTTSSQAFMNEIKYMEGPGVTQ